MNRKLLALTIPLFAGVLMAGVSHRPEKPQCEVAAEWVLSLGDNLPRTLPELSKLSLSYRKAVYRALPQGEQMALWHAQLAHYGASETLTKAQRDFILEIDGAFEQYFGVDKIDGLQIRFKARAVEVLGRDLTKQVFMTLGVNTPEEREAVASKLPAECQCSIQSDFCSAGMDCEGAVCDHHLGCGWFWCELCMGNCAIT